MFLKIERSASAFKNNLTSLEQAVLHHKIINNRLEVIEKTTLFWRFICLLSSVCSVFGYDVFSHIRINHVAKSLFSYCQINKQYLDQALINRINSNILNNLNNRTSNKYRSSLEKLSSNLDTLIPPKFSKKLHWPADLKEIGLNEKKKKALEKIFSQALPLISSCENTYFLTKEKSSGQDNVRNLTIKKNEVVLITHSLPITIAFIKKDHLSHIVLMGKKVLGKGGERGKVRLCYDLTEGTYLARKKITTATEKRLIKNLQQHPRRGIVALFGTRKSLEPLHKEQILEYRYDTSLTDFISQEAPLDTRLSLTQDLLYGLDSLHEITMKYPFYRGLRIPLVKGFHHDLKPCNIVVRSHPVTKKLEAAITDFGFACNPSILGGTAGFTAPEEVGYEHLHRPLVRGGPIQTSSQKIIDHNAKYG